MEGATRCVIRPSLFQRHIAVDQVNKVNPRQQILDEGFRDHLKREE